MINNALKQVIDNIYLDKENLSKRVDAETDPYKKHDLQFELDTTFNEKFSKIYLEMIENISDSKNKELETIIEGILGDNYERFINNIFTVRPDSTFRDVCRGVPTAILVKKFDDTVEKLSELVDDKTMNKVALTLKTYIPGSVDNTPIHPYNEIIKTIKNGKNFNSLSKDEREKVSKQLDEINEIVKESPRKYSDAQTNFDSDYERITNKNNNEFFKEYVTNINKDFNKGFTYNDLTFVVKKDVADDPEKVAVVKSPSFILSKETQESILKVWKKMDELGIISAGDGKETGKKIYGFDKLYKARLRLDNALESEQFDNLEELKNDYDKQVKNLREVYKLIKSELSPSPDRIPGNVQNFREDFVPAEFKNDICINATLNGMYNAYSIVKSMGITAEEFLSNPQPYIDKNFNDELTKLHIDRYYKDLSFEETLTRVYTDKSKAGINAHGMPRMVATLNCCEKNNERRQNNTIYSAVQSGKIEAIYDDEQICYNYFNKEKTNSFINLLFVNPEDRDFYKLRACDYLTWDKLHKIKAFDLASYLKEKQISSNDIRERITTFLTTAYKISSDSEKLYAKQRKTYEKLLEEYKKGKIKVCPEMPASKTLSSDDFVHMVKDIQQGVMAFVMLADPSRDTGIDKLVDILKNPAEALKSLNMTEEYVNKLNKLKGKDAVLNENMQNAINENKLDIIAIRANETLYNKTAEKILKEANKISLKVANTNDAKKIEELQKRSVMKLNELKQLQKAETERLEKEYKDGSIPKEYYKARIDNILSLKHNEKIAIFDDGLNKNSYIKSTGLEGLSKNEANKLFDCEIEKQKVEKQFFINKQFLQNHNLISANRDVEVKTANFEQIDVSLIDGAIDNVQREPLVVDEAKLEISSEKSQPQKEIDPQQTVKMP